MNTKSNGFSLKSATENRVISDRLKEAKKSMGLVSSIELINTDEIDNWEYRDRKDFELGDIDSLAYSIKNNGQAQPIVITESNSIFKPKNKDTKYVVIAGYRRWLACKKIGIKIEAVVKDFTFEDAIACVISENKKESVSDYSKGIFYMNILNSEKMTQQDLSAKTGITLSSLKNYLAFSRIPDDIINAINNMSKVSARSAIEVVSLANKGKEYHQALLKIADKIRSGYGEKRIRNEVNKIINKSDSNKNIDVRKVVKNEKILATISGKKINLSKEVIENKKYNDFINDVEVLLQEYFGEEQ